MDENNLLKNLEAISRQLSRIADALETIALANAPKAPNYVRPITEYQTFDWESIGAQVVESDSSGVAQVQWGGYLWTRRSPQNKFGEAIWFSRPEGKNAEGKTRYSRLITFQKPMEAEPVPERTLRSAGGPVIDAPTPTPRSLPPRAEQQEPRERGGERQPRPNLDDEIPRLQKPSEAARLLDRRNGPTVFWMTVERFKIPRETASAVAQAYRNDWAGALQALEDSVS